MVLHCELKAIGSMKWCGLVHMNFVTVHTYVDLLVVRFSRNLRILESLVVVLINNRHTHVRHFVLLQYVRMYCILY